MIKIDERIDNDLIEAVSEENIHIDRIVQQGEVTIYSDHRGIIWGVIDENEVQDENQN